MTTPDNLASVPYPAGFAFGRSVSDTCLPAFRSRTAAPGCIRLRFDLAACLHVPNRHSSARTSSLMLLSLPAAQNALSVWTHGLDVIMV